MGNARLKFLKSKQKLRNILRPKFCYFNIILFHHLRYHPKIIEDIIENVQKTSAFVLKMLLTPIRTAEIVECVRAYVDGVSQNLQILCPYLPGPPKVFLFFWIIVKQVKSSS